MLTLVNDDFKFDCSYFKILSFYSVSFSYFTWQLFFCSGQEGGLWLEELEYAGTGHTEELFVEEERDICGIQVLAFL